jgi:hypothetical protein
MIKVTQNLSEWHDQNKILVSSHANEDASHFHLEVAKFAFVTMVYKQVWILLSP